jgi:hypothetical protein
MTREFAEHIYEAYKNTFAFEEWEYVSTLDNKLERYIGQDYDNRR